MTVYHAVQTHFTCKEIKVILYDRRIKVRPEKPVSERPFILTKSSMGG